MNEFVANNMKAFRQKAGYSREQVARALGVTRYAYSHYESGDREVPYEVLEKIGNLYGCEVSDLFAEHLDLEAQWMASAPSLKGLTPEDAAEIMRFKDIVKSYLRMDAIGAN